MNQRYTNIIMENNDNDNDVFSSDTSSEVNSDQEDYEMRDIMRLYQFDDDLNRLYDSMEDDDSTDCVDTSDYSSMYESEYEPRAIIQHPKPDTQYRPKLDTQYPKPDWISPYELRLKKYGFSYSKQILPNSNINLFEKSASSSMWMIRRLKNTNTLCEHSGSVNCLDFDSSGKLLCSGISDCYISIWDWQGNKLKTKIHSGHDRHVSQSKFCNLDYNIITSSYDGTVRLMYIESKQTERLISKHESTINGLEFTSPNTVLSCSSDGSVDMIDFRSKTSNRINKTSYPMLTITSHPIDKYKVAIAGFSSWIYIYDLRQMKGVPTEYIFNDHRSKCGAESIAYNSNGDKMLINNNGDLLVCETDSYSIIKRYKGHRDNIHFQSCIWFGDNYVMSGSIDGIYGWDFDTEHIVSFLQVDKIVSQLCLNPTIPILATSCYDYDIKIWEPNADI